MEDVSVMSRYSVKNTHAVQLYSANTANGIKVSIMLEELQELRAMKGDFVYEAHTVDIRTSENRKLFPIMKINPNGRIPAIIDPVPADHGEQLAVFESGAILMYLAEKYQELLPVEGRLRYQCIEWLFWGSTGLSSQVKLFGFYYHYCVHPLPYCMRRYTKEVTRLLGVLESQLAGHRKHWIVGDMYSVADICAFPW
jgi:GSH-dependent disulfide-bond oxidoreductase